MHCLKNFKNFSDAQLDLFEPLTILLGRNGSGKTNLIEGVELMAAIARGVPFGDITDVGRGGDLEVRGGLAACQRFGTSSFELRFNRAVILFDGASPVDYMVKVSTGEAGGVHPAEERLIVGERIFFEAHSEDGEISEIKYANFSSGRNPHCRLSTSSSVLSRYDEVVANSRTASDKLRKAKRAVGSVTRYLRGSHIFDPAPKAMRNYERVAPQPRLLRNGSNLSAVLLALSKGEKSQKATLARITETIRQIPEEPFQEIGFEETGLGDVMAGFRVADGPAAKSGRLIDARLLSDGTLRMLAVLTALETVPKSSRIVIEEFDNGLHPSRAELLVGHLAEAAKRRKLNIVLTTHNPAFMNALNEEQMRCVWVCHRDSSGNGSKVTRLADIDQLVAAGLGGGLGDFVAGGALDRRLAPDYREQRSAKLQEWIESVS